MLSPVKKLETKLRPALAGLKDKPNLVGAEIGVQWGLHAHTILNLLDMEKLYLIDPYVEFGDDKGRISCSSTEHLTIKNAAHRRLAGYVDKVIWIEDYSSNAVVQIPNGSLDFVYIDADHRYEFVLSDIQLYLPKVKSGGYIAGHDYGRKVNGVKKAVTYIFGNNHSHAGVDWWTTKD